MWFEKKLEKEYQIPKIGMKKSGELRPCKYILIFITTLPQTTTLNLLNVSFHGFIPIKVLFILYGEYNTIFTALP